MMMIMIMMMMMKYYLRILYGSPMCLYDKARALLCAIDTFDITGSTLLCNINVVNDVDVDDVDVDVDVDVDDVDDIDAERQCVIAEESGIT